MIGATLRRAGFRVLTAEDGVIGSSLFRIHHAEIVAIVSDAVSVPEIDPASFGSALAMLLGSLGLLERRRLKAA